MSKEGNPSGVFGAGYTDRKETFPPWPEERTRESREKRSRFLGHDRVPLQRILFPRSGPAGADPASSAAMYTSIEGAPLGLSILIRGRLRGERVLEKRAKRGPRCTDNDTVHEERVAGILSADGTV